MSERAVLITGADGYLGTRVAARYLQESDRPLVLWVRARDEQERRQKEARLGCLFGRQVGRWRVRAGDLRQPAPFRDVDPAAVGTIVHAAAHIRFDADRATAEAVNVAGTDHILEFARRCPHLETVGLLSSVYATGLLGGRIDEEPVSPPAFANEYERSKCLAERHALDAGLPCHIFRVATVLADDDSGRVGQYNFAHKTLELLYRGLMSVFPGAPEATAYLVTGDLVTRTVLAVLESGTRSGIWHLCPRREQALSLRRLLDVVWTTFEHESAFRRVRLPRPRFLNEAGFDTLSAAMATFSSGGAGDAFRALRPFARQLYVAKDLSNDRLTARLGAGLRFPEPVGLLTRVCTGLVASRWAEATHAAAGRSATPVI